MLDISPLQKYCQDMDDRNTEMSFREIHRQVRALDTQYFTNIVIKDWEWRANHQQNIIASIEGQQGCGKSLFANDMCLRLGQMFNNPFLPERDLYINPFDLDHELRTCGSRRRTFLYDEQSKRRAGMGSVTTAISLTDYEEICRYTQNNLIYCSPEIVNHAHYFIFKEVNYGVERKMVKACRECVKYNECHADYYDTLCDLKFWERDGYPVSFSFMLETKRLSDSIFVPRGVVTLPMVSWKSADIYNKVKAVNIKRFENFENDSWDNQKKMMEEFAKEYEATLFIPLKKGGFKIAPAKRIELKFFDKFGTERFTNRQVDVFVERVKEILTDRLESYINENEDSISDV